MTPAPRAAQLTELWAIYDAPTGSPASFLVQRWTGSPGSRLEYDPPVFAASLEQARAVIPPGFERQDPAKAKLEAARLLEWWRPKQ